MNRLVFLFIFLFSVCFAAVSQNISVEEYIAKFKAIAISEMKRSGVPASITLAQGLLETESGNSELVRRSNNHFGIKCKSSWTGKTVYHDDDESGECFRKYENADDSYIDHSNFLKGSERYAPLFKISPKDYKGWAYGLKKAGYATNPAYPSILIKNIEKYNLHQYTLMGLGELHLDDAIDVVEPIFVASTEAILDTSAIVISKGKTLFNSLKAVFVSKGTSLLAIATDNNISLAKLMEYNDLENDGLVKDDCWIYLERKFIKSKKDPIILKSNETPYDIAQANGIQLASLLSFNNLQSGEVVKAGTTIYFRPGELSDPVAAPSNEKQKKQNYHEVAPREGLYTISKKYNVSVEDIRLWNNLSNDNLRVGQKLIISK